VGVEDRPVTGYAKAPDGVRIAFQATGEGEFALVWCPALIFPVDLLWDEPGFARFARRLGGFGRTVWCEPRGIGASGGDPFDGLVEETAIADLTAVLDAAGCERVALLGSNHGGPTAIRYAATYPERVSALIVVDTYAHYMAEPDYPWGGTDAFGARSGEWFRERDAFSSHVWGTGATADFLAPSKAGDPAFRAWCARSERLGVGPEASGPWYRAAVARDVRDLLPALSVRTLVLHRAANAHIDVGAGRYIAEHVPGARFVELPGEDYLFFVGETDMLLDEIEEFVTGSRQPPEGDVITSTILFTDIVASTEQSARLGHRRWTKLTDAHDTMVRSSLARHRGQEIKTIGDGFLATFDGTSRAVRAASEIVNGASGLGVEVRAGVHTGEIEVRPDDVVGLAVSIAKRICDLARPGQVLISETVRGQLVGHDITLSDQGAHALKGVPGTWRLFAIGG